MGFICRHPGLLLVLIGVVGEIIFDWKEMGSGRLAYGKKISAILLVIGLIAEFAEAAQADQQIVSQELRIEELRNQNDSLEKELQWRTVTPKQKLKILDALHDLQFQQKCKVQIVADQNDVEAFAFMQDIGNVLEQVGFEVEMTAPMRFFDPSKPLPIGFQMTAKYNAPWPPGASEIIGAFSDAGLPPTAYGPNSSAPDSTLLIEIFHKPHSNLK